MWIYHELQDSLLCGQHALNNLIQQQDFFNAGDLADIAHQLDSEEQRYMEGNLSGPSGNVDAQGNFSIQVITNALHNIGIDLTVWKMAQSGEPSLEVGFIVNRDHHWFSIRRINGKWWDLNSSRDAPHLISDFYLSAFLSQLVHEQYSVFVARGDFPQLCANPTTKGPFWHLESDLLKSDSAHVVDKDKFSGKGNRLGDGRHNDEDADVAAAIALSLSDSQSSNNKHNSMADKENIRAKRLAALGIS